MEPKGTTRRGFLKGVAGAGASLALARTALSRTPPQQGTSVVGLTVPAMRRVRAALIGIGARGSGHLGHLLSLEGVDVTAVCDSFEPAMLKAQERCVKAGKPKPAGFARGEEDYKRMLERDDIDIVVIATPWRWHTPMCVDSMEAGKHAFTEVPAAITLDECWQLVNTAEKTRRHCMMMENVCYGREELMVLNMCRQGLFGDLVHGAGAYLHDLRGQMNQIERGTGSWRTRHHEVRNGNLYPTHGLGPIAQYMNINRGDRFDYLISMSSPALGRQLYAKEHFAPDHARNQARYICGDMNTSLIKTALGRSILVQHDTTSPRPYSRLNLIQGTRGMFGGFPDRIVVEGRGPTHGWQDLEPYRQEFEHPLWKRMGEEAAKAGGHGGMDFLMLWRTVTCLRGGEALDQDVYDAASWSAVSALSEYSVAHRGAPIDFPDFTRGHWKTTKPLGIVS